MAKAKESNNINKDLEYYSKLPYSINIDQCDDGNGIYYVAKIAELPHCLIHGNTPEEALKEIEEVKLDWIKSNLKRCFPVPEPELRKCSGQIRLRMPSSLHRLITEKALRERISINQYMNMVLAQSVGFGGLHSVARQHRSLTVAKQSNKKTPTVRKIT